MNTKAIYNKIGKSYDTTRKADPAIVQTLLRLLQPKNDGNYLDIACGSGNYTDALMKTGIKIEGIDISEEMISKARTKNNEINWHLGDATALGFKDESFDGALCTLATHHIQDIETGFKEAYRIINQGNFALLTCLPVQMQDYWLREYFPKMIQESAKQFCDFERIENALKRAGFKNIRQEPFYVTAELADLFLYSGKQRPEMYLDPNVRAGISSFHLYAYGDEIEKGLAQLELDIKSGKILELIASYESSKGDYLFVVGEKQS